MYYQAARGSLRDLTSWRRTFGYELPSSETFTNPISKDSSIALRVNYPPYYNYYDPTQVQETWM